jgi:hypothetical protein
LADALDELRRAIHDDTALSDRLNALPPEDVLAEVVRIARMSGHDVTRVDVDAAVRDAQREWLMRWTT